MLTYNLLNDSINLRTIMDSFFLDDEKQTDYPQVALQQHNDTLNIQVVVPGLKSEDIDVELENNYLKIEGTKKSNQGDIRYLRKERSFGSFIKRIKLPFRVDSKQIDATMENGILFIELNKSEDAKPKKISIQ